MKRHTDPYAVHEAGHALVAVLSGLPIKWVDMHADRASADERGWPTAVKGLRLRRVKVTAATDVSLRMAGKAAEFVCGHDIPDSDNFDRSCASQILDIVCKSRKERHPGQLHLGHDRGPPVEESPRPQGAGVRAGRTGPAFRRRGCRDRGELHAHQARGQEGASGRVNGDPAGERGGSKEAA